MRIAGWIPAARRRSSASPPLASSIACSRSSRPIGIRRRLAIGQLQLQQGADELLLRAVVQVALELGARRVRRLDDAPPGDAQLGRARLGDVALARRLLGAALLLDIAERGDRAAAAGQVEGRRGVGHAHDRAVLAHEPVLEVLQGLPRLARADERAVLLGEGRAVGVLVVDGVVRVPAHEVGELLVAQRGERRGIGVVEAARRVGDPHRLSDRREDRLALAQRLLGRALLLDVLEGDDHARPVGHVDRRRGVGDREHRAVAADEPVLVHLDRLTRSADLGHRAVLGWIRRTVAVLVVDGVVAEAAA